MTTPFHSTDLSLLAEWADHDTDMVVDDIEGLSDTSNQEVSKVLEQWQSDHEDDNDDACVSNSDDNSTSSDDECVDFDIMEIDEQIGSNLLGDDVFGGPCCSSPTGPLEELVLMSVDDEERFFAPLLDDDDGDVNQELLEASVVLTADDIVASLVTSTTPTFSYEDGDKKNSTTTTPSPFLFDERYRETLKKLEESMKRSQETRRSLTMKTPKTEQYGRSKSVSGVLTSIENSSRQIQTYLQTVQRTV
jgi:hypothetical protein